MASSKSSCPSVVNNNMSRGIEVNTRSIIRTLGRLLVLDFVYGLNRCSSLRTRAFPSELHMC